MYNSIRALKLRNFGRDAQFSLTCGRMCFGGCQHGTNRKVDLPSHPIVASTQMTIYRLCRPVDLD